MIVLAIVVVILVLFFGLVVFIGAPYVPSLRKDLGEAFDELYELKPTDLVVDIGSGDGTVLREISRRGAKGFGIEINPILVLISRFLSRRDPNVTTRFANLWQVSFPDKTTVVYVFCMGRDIERITKLVTREATRLNRPLTMISFGFEIKDRRPKQRTKTHFLYEILPLQPGEAQV